MFKFSQGKISNLSQLQAPKTGSKCKLVALEQITLIVYVEIIQHWGHRPSA
jgi:hypothetical protein